MDRYVIKLVKYQMQDLSNGHMNNHFQLFCILKSHILKGKGKKHHEKQIKLQKPLKMIYQPLLGVYFKRETM